jgi:hypothetical protein
MSPPTSKPMQPGNPAKTCKKCSTKQDLSQFHRSRSQPDGYQSWCKVCQKAAYCARYKAKDKSEAVGRVQDWRRKNPAKVRNSHLKRMYGLDQDKYEQLLAVQNGGCWICHRPPDDRPLCVDHDHKSGGVRGLLCITCNTGLGGFKDSIQLMERAILYLSRYSLPIQDRGNSPFSD